MLQIPLILAYFGPETVMPMTSILATVVGVFLMFGKSLIRLGTYWARRATLGMRRGKSTTRPHFGLGKRRRGRKKATIKG